MAESPDYSERLQTVTLASWIFGSSTGPPLDDPAEVYHEASKIYPSFAGRDTAGVRRLEENRQLQFSATRGLKRHRQYPAVSLPEPRLPDVAFSDVVRTRESRREFAPKTLSLSDLSTTLQTAYGVTHSSRLPGGRRGQPLRAVPSGGALYPLELYVLAQRVNDLPAGLYHFDPWRHILERLPRRADHEPAELTAYPELLENCGALVLITAVFWRTRFKYALRGYRFALLEAGHVGQNLLLAATALGLGSVSIGGVYDRRVEDVLGVDGVNESIVYVVALGQTPELEQ